MHCECRSLIRLALSTLCLAAVIVPTAVFAHPQSGGEQQSAGTESDEKPDETKQDEAEEKPFKKPTRAQLRRKLNRMQFYVTQQEGTEEAFNNEYWNNKKEGTYFCVVCEKPLFKSDTKFVSGTGWPSFWAPLESKSVGTKTDWKMVYPRTEVHCSRCEAHLGHVFEDGPKPTGLRYCMNSAALKFVEKKDKSDDDGERKAAAGSADDRL